MGVMFTNRTPAARIRRNPARTRCSDGPPGVTWVFFSGTPPKVTNSFVCSASTDQAVWMANISSIGAIRCGSSTRAAPRL